MFVTQLTRPPSRFALWPPGRLALYALTLLLLPTHSWAIEIAVPCARPSVFSAAAVNVVVMPYSVPPALRTSSAVGAQLAGLVQLETVLSIAKYGSIGVTQLVGDAGDECTPEIVLDKLLGKQGGARETMRPGNGLILIWGRIFESGADLYLQSFVQFLRPGTTETVDVSVRDRTLKGTLSTQAFACAPRKIAIKDLEDIQRQFRSARLLYAQPNSSSRSVQIPDRGESLAFWVTDLRGDWVQLEPMDRGTNRKFERGWLQVRPTDAQWSLRAKMPELYFVEGVAGYLMARVRSDSQTIVGAALQGAESAITRYIESWGANAVLGNDATTNGTPLAVAVPRQLRGFVALLRGRGTDGGMAEARTHFERAAALASHSSDARNLVTITQVAQTFRQPVDAQPPRRFVDEVRALLGSDPSNAMVLANLGIIYDLVLASVPDAPASWTLSAAERDRLSRQRESLKRLKSS
jgi:hypothetical protein